MRPGPFALSAVGKNSLRLEETVERRVGMKKIFVTAVEFNLQSRPRLQIFVDREVSQVTCEIEEMISVVLVKEGIIEFQKRGLTEVGFGRGEGFEREKIEVRLIRSVERPDALDSKIESCFFVEGMDVIEPDVLRIIACVGVFVKIGVAPF